MGLLKLTEKLTRSGLHNAGYASRWITTSVARHHVYEANSGGPLPPLVVLHGISSSATAFAPLLFRVAKKHSRVIAPDAPGHGFSDAPRAPLTATTLFSAMTELFDALLDEPAVFFGNSLGGGMALSYALARPSKVRGLFLASPAGAAADDAELAAFMKTFDMPSRAEANAFLDKLYHRKPWFVPVFARDVQEMFSSEPVATFRASITSKDLFTSEQLGSLAMPIRFLWGRSERLMPSAHLAFFKASLPKHAVIDEPEGFGHCPHFDDPRGLVAMIEDFSSTLRSA